MLYKGPVNSILWYNGDVIGPIIPCVMYIYDSRTVTPENPQGDRIAAVQFPCPRTNTLFGFNFYPGEPTMHVALWIDSPSSGTSIYFP
jgi:hypothetical protein